MKYPPRKNAILAATFLLILWSSPLSAQSKTNEIHSDYNCKCTDPKMMAIDKDGNLTIHTIEKFGTEQAKIVNGFATNTNLRGHIAKAGANGVFWTWKDKKIYRWTIDFATRNTTQKEIPVPDDRLNEVGKQFVTVDSANNIYKLEGKDVYRYSYSPTQSRWTTWREHVIKLQFPGDPTYIVASGDAEILVANGPGPDRGHLYRFRYDQATHHLFEEPRLLGSGMFDFGLSPSGSGSDTLVWIWGWENDRHVAMWRFKNDDSITDPARKWLASRIVERWDNIASISVFNGACTDSYPRPKLAKIVSDYPTKVSAASVPSESRAALAYVDDGDTPQWAISSTVDSSWTDQIVWNALPSNGKPTIDPVTLFPLPDSKFAMITRSRDGLAQMFTEKNKEVKDLSSAQDISGGFNHISAISFQDKKILTGVDEQGQVWINQTLAADFAAWVPLKTDIRALPNSKAVTAATAENVRIFITKADGIAEVVYQPNDLSVSSIEMMPSLPANTSIREAISTSVNLNGNARVAFTDEVTGTVWITGRRGGEQYSAWNRVPFNNKVTGIASVDLQTGKGYIFARGAGNEALVASEEKPNAGTYLVKQAPTGTLTRDPWPLAVTVMNQKVFGFFALTESGLRFYAFKSSSQLQSLGSAELQDFDQIVDLKIKPPRKK